MRRNDIKIGVNMTTLKELSQTSEEATKRYQEQFLKDIEQRLIAKARNAEYNLCVMKLTKVDIKTIYTYQGFWKGTTSQVELVGFAKEVFDYCKQRNWNPKFRYYLLPTFSPSNEKCFYDGSIMIYWSKEDA